MNKQSTNRKKMSQTEYTNRVHCIIMISIKDYLGGQYGKIRN